YGLVAPDAACVGSAEFQSAVSPISNRQGVESSGRLGNESTSSGLQTRDTAGSNPALLLESKRPFRLWESAGGEFAKAVALIPANWPKPRRALWEARRAAIRDNEHIRRIEHPDYKPHWY